MYIQKFSFDACCSGLLCGGLKLGCEVTIVNIIFFSMAGMSTVGSLSLCILLNSASVN